MGRIRPSGDPRAAVRWIAWGWAVAAAAVFMWLAETRGIPAGPEGAVISAGTSTTLHLAALGVVAAGLMASIRLPTLGGMVVGVGAIALGVLATVEYRPAAAFLAALAFLVPAVLLVAAGRVRGRRITAAAAAVGFAAILAVGWISADRVHRQVFGPFHPVSDTARLPVVSVRWMWSGAVTPDGATVVARLVDAGARARLVVTGPEGPRRSDPAAADGRGVVRMRVAGLSPGTEYRYEVEVDGRVTDPRRGRFRTLPAAGPASFVVAVASCATTGSNGRVFDEIRRRRPLVYLQSGDLFYANVDTDRGDAFERPYEDTLTSPAQSALYREVPVAYVWDDHDFGTNDSAGDAPSRAAAMSAYRTMVPHPPLAFGGPGAPIAQAFTAGRVRFILTDLRSARTPADAPDAAGKTMLGAAQRAWLVREVAAATRRGQLPVWVSSSPWVAEARPGADSWAGYATERAAITRALAARGVRSLVILAGDAHMVAIDDGSHSAPLAAGGRVPVLQAAALDEWGDVKGGPYSEGTAPGAGQFGTLRVDDPGGASIRVTLEGWNWRGERLMALTRTLPLGPAPGG